MSDSQKNYRFLFSPYIFSLCIFMIVAIAAVSIFLIFYAPVAGERGVLTAFILGLDVLLLAALCATPVCFGWYAITGEAITLHAPFRRPLTLRYDDVRYVGAGRNFLSVNYAYWLYLSVEPVPREAFEDMRRFRLTSRGLRIAYSRKVFAALQDCLPEDLRRQLAQAKATLQGWGVRDA